MTVLDMRPVLGAVDRLEPVGLEELVSRAALQTRVDRKYVLPVPAAERVLAGLSGHARALEIDGRRSFGYESLYYDTPELDSYHLAAYGRRRRFKVRRRTYLDSAESFVEVKTRGSRGSTVKERVPEAPSEGLQAAGRGLVDDVLDRAGIAGIAPSRLRPALRTSYRRSTLLLPATDSRVTVDTDLCWCLPDGEAVAVAGLAVVETKSGSAPSPADRHLWANGHRPVRISKYATGLAALRAGLPTNRWHPVLRRHVLPALLQNLDPERNLSCAS